MGQEYIIPLNLGASLISCIAKHSARAKYTRIKIKPGGIVEVVIPFRTTRENVMAFLNNEKDWIRRNLLEMKRKDAVAGGQYAPFFTDSIRMDFFNAEFRIKYDFQDTAWCAVRLDQNAHEIIFSGNVLNAELVADSFAMLLKRLGKTYLGFLLNEKSIETGIPYQNISTRLQSRRWGSCTSSGNISLNALLLLLPREMAEYVTVHELVHLRHMDHSDAFWAEVAKYIPDWEKRREILNARAEKIPPFLRRLR